MRAVVVGLIEIEIEPAAVFGCRGWTYYIFGARSAIFRVLGSTMAGVAENNSAGGGGEEVPFLARGRCIAERLASAPLATAEMREVLAVVRRPSSLADRCDLFWELVIGVRYDHPSLGLVVVKDSTLTYEDGALVATSHEEGCLGLHLVRRGQVVTWGGVYIFPGERAQFTEQCGLCMGGSTWCDLCFCPLCGPSDAHALENMLILANTMPMSRCHAKYGHRRVEGKVSLFPLRDRAMQGNLEIFLR